MIAVADEKELYLDQFVHFEKSLGRDRGRLQNLREHALQRFKEIGFPTARTEDWRFTSVVPLTRTVFELADSRPVEKSLLNKLNQEPGIRLVFINGRLNQALSQLKDLPGGVVAESLEVALTTRGDRIEPFLARLANVQDLPFTALNTAFLRDGAFVEIPAGKVLEQPIEVVFVTLPGEKPVVSYPRTLLVLGQSSQASVVERYLGTEDGIYFTNAVTEIALGENAILDHYKLQEESLGAFHVANMQVRLQRSSNFRTHFVSLGGRLVRNEVRVLLDDEGSEATVNGLYLGRGHQHIDNHTVIDHAKPHCNSHELYKGILSDQSKGVFNGKIFVRKDAQKTDAKQTNQALLLSEEATINTKPQLEIFADDVKCTHGATVGQLAAEAIFYLRSRGIGHQEARSLLTFAFANDILDRIRLEPIRRRLETVLTQVHHLTALPTPEVL